MERENNRNENINQIDESLQLLTLAAANGDSISIKLVRMCYTARKAVVFLLSIRNSSFDVSRNVCLVCVEYVARRRHLSYSVSFKYEAAIERVFRLLKQLMILYLNKIG